MIYDDSSYCQQEFTVLDFVFYTLGLAILGGPSECVALDTEGRASLHLYLWVCKALTAKIFQQMDKYQKFRLWQNELGRGYPVSSVRLSLYCASDRNCTVLLRYCGASHLSTAWPGKVAVCSLVPGIVPWSLWLYPQRPAAPGLHWDDTWFWSVYFWLCVDFCC